MSDFKHPDDVLMNPRDVLVWWLWLLRRLGFPEPDPFWKTTRQVNPDASFGRRFLCLYLGHDMRERKVREPNGSGYTHRSDCDRCEWEGPWTR